MKRVIIAIVLYIYEGWEDHGLHSVSWRIRKGGWSQFEGLRVRGTSVVSPSQSPKTWEPGEPNVSEQEKRMSHSSKERKFALLLPFCSNQVINRLDEKCSYQLGWSSLVAVVVQSLSPVWLFVTPWTAACQAYLPFTTSLSMLKLMFIKSAMPSNHLILCLTLLLPSIFPALGYFP